MSSPGLLGATVQTCLVAFSNRSPSESLAFANLGMLSSSLATSKAMLQCWKGVSHLRFVQSSHYDVA